MNIIPNTVKTISTALFFAFSITQTSFPSAQTPSNTMQYTDPDLVLLKQIIIELENYGVTVLGNVKDFVNPKYAGLTTTFIPKSQAALMQLDKTLLLIGKLPQSDMKNKLYLLATSLHKTQEGFLKTISNYTGKGMIEYAKLGLALQKLKKDQKKLMANIQQVQLPALKSLDPNLMKKMNEVLIALLSFDTPEKSAKDALWIRTNNKL